MNSQKTIIVGVTGGIAAFKTCSLVSSLTKQGYDVHVIMTKSACEFVTPLTFQTLSKNKVITDMFTVDYTPEVHHISLAKKADLFVIAPATADVIAKVANGICDDMLTTTFLASTCNKLIVPAMNTQMLENSITQDNIARCKQYGMHVLDSGDGRLACGDIGQGRMLEPDEIEDVIKQDLNAESYLKGKRILVTAGPTQEAMDPIRYITNHSSGKMGYALARAARNAGAIVTLISGNTHLKPVYGVEMVDVTTAQEMYEEVMKRQEDHDVFIMAAAVADFRPKVVATSKIHKSNSGFQLELERTQDILETLGKNRKPYQTLIGFAMETEDLLVHAKEKLERKNCDFIVANNINEKGAGFKSDTNKVTILSKNTTIELGLLSKEDTAQTILKTCLKG